MADQEVSPALRSNLNNLRSVFPPPAFVETLVSNFRRGRERSAGRWRSLKRAGLAGGVGPTWFSVRTFSLCVSASCPGGCHVFAVQQLQVRSQRRREAVSQEFERISCFSPRYQSCPSQAPFPVGFSFSQNGGRRFQSPG